MCQDGKVYKNRSYPNHMQQWRFSRTIMNNLVFVLKQIYELHPTLFGWNSETLAISGQNVPSKAKVDAFKARKPWHARTIWIRLLHSAFREGGVNTPFTLLLLTTIFLVNFFASSYPQLLVLVLFGHFANLLFWHRCVHLSLLVHVHTPWFVIE